VGVSVAYPLPGTAFFEQVKGQFLNGKTHWKDSGDLAMMFRGTYSSDFYRAVRDLLHAEVTVGHLHAGEATAQYQREQQRLARSWATLQTQESTFRVAKTG
jgi:anaerobic magnesium-protoporphyrin IX monomethyl ester cyclase